MNIPSLPCEVKFIYQGSDYYIAREVVCSKLCHAACMVLPLPNVIEIRFANLGPSIYGHTHLEHRYCNRLSIHCYLSVTELPTVLIHELIHMSQVHTGMLRVSSSGTYYWNGVAYDRPHPDTMDYLTYIAQPWECDVDLRHTSVMSAVLAQAMKLG